MARNAVLLVGSIGMAGMAAAESALRSPGIVGILGALALLNLLTWLRLRRSTPVSYNEFLLQILADVVLLAAAMRFSGGDASPFHDLYFVPLTVAAATLPWRHTVVVAAAIALPEHDMVDLLAGALIAYFAFSMASTSRKHEGLLARIREDYLKQRHLRELGTLAATTADRMSSPLGTMAIVVGELRDGACRHSEYQQALDVIANRIELCKQILSRLLASAGFGHAETVSRMPADRFLAGIVDKCQLLQPWLALQCRYEGPSPAPAMLAETSLEQAILVFLSSAPAAPIEVEVSAQWDRKSLRVRMCTAGSLPPETSASVPLFARKSMTQNDRQDLFMAKATIARFGGTVEEATQQDGHACVKLLLPLSDSAA